MLNYDDKNSDCSFAEVLVSYLYGEANQAEKLVFEAHLKDCVSCGEELKEFNAARTAVREWRVADFDSLPTPIFEIPAQTIQPAAKTEKSASRFGSLAQIFSFRPAMAMSALVLLIALFGIAAYIFNFKPEATVAENFKDKNSARTAVSPTVETKNEDKKNAEIVKRSAPEETAAVNPPVKIVEQNSAPLKSAPLKTSTVTPKNNVVKTVRNDAKKSPDKSTAPKTDVPQIVEADDEEDDDSIRLADLFDEIGTE